MTEQRTQIRVLPATRQKIDAISKAKRWNLGVTVDVITDEYVMRQGIEVPATTATRSQPRKERRPVLT